MKVRLYLRVRLANGVRQFIDPVFAANGKLKPFYALVNRNPEHHPEGVYYLRYLKLGKRVWENVGTDAPSAVTARLKRERILAAQAAGVEIPDEKETKSRNGRDLNEAIAEYLSEVKVGKRSIQAGMSQPALDRPHRYPRFVVHRRKRFAEAVQPPVMADRLCRATLALSVVALTAI